MNPILFELLPQKFTIPQLHELYEGIYDTKLDKRNFSRKVLSTKLLVKQKEKEKENSKKGLFIISSTVASAILSSMPFLILLQTAITLNNPFGFAEVSINNCYFDT